LKKKILRIITRLNIGGPTQHVLFVTRDMQGKNFETKLITGFCERQEGDMSYLAKEFNVEPIFVKEMSRAPHLLKDFRAFLKLYSILKKEKPDIVHTHTAKAGALGRMASILSGTGIRVHTFHGHSLEEYFSKIHNAIFSLIERFLGFFTHKIIAISKVQAEELSEKHKIADKKKFTVIELGLDLELFLKIDENRRGTLRKEFRIDDDVIFIGIVARLVEVKNHKMFFDVVKAIEPIARKNKYKFIILGDGELRKNLESYAEKLGIKDLVIFTGWCRDMTEAYKSLDIVLLTSNNEGTPVSLIEALASARPVISTDVGGVRNVVLDGKNGYVVGKNDTKVFSERLLELAGDRQKRIKFGLAGREYVKKRFSTARLVRDLEELYTNLLQTEKKYKQ